MSTKKDLARIRKLMKSSEHREQAIGLLEALDDDALWDGVLSDLEFQVAHGDFRIFTFSAAALLAAAPDHLTQKQAWQAELGKLMVQRSVPFEPKMVPGVKHLKVRRDRKPWAAAKDLHELRDLEWLHISSCEVSLGTLGELAHLTFLQLESLVLEGELPRLPVLEQLTLRMLPGPVTLPSLPSLEELRLWNLESEVDLGGVADSAKLRSFEVVGELRGSLVPLGGALAKGAPLSKISVQRAQELQSLEGLQGAQHLEELTMRISAVQSVAPLVGSERLERLVMTKAQLSSLDGLEDAAGTLQLVDVRNNPDLADVSALTKCSQLRVLALHGTAVRPEDVPAPLRKVATWAPEPYFTVLLQRPALAAAGN